MTDCQAFVASIQARPGDDLRRLAFADWLEENGESPRALFVRHQVAAARLPRWCKARLDHEDAADALLARHRGEWLGAWASRTVGCEFRRGFVRNITMRLKEWERYGDELMGWEPVIGVSIDHDRRRTPPEAEIALLLRRPGVARLRELFIISSSAVCRTEWSLQVAAANHLTELRAYGIDWDNGTSDGVLQSLCRAKHLRRLRELRLLCNLNGKKSEDAHAVTLAGATFAPSLRSFAFRMHASDAVANGAFPNLRRLGDIDISMMIRRKTLTTCDPPRVRRVEVRVEQLAEYAKSPLAKRVRDLTIRGNHEERVAGTVCLEGWQALTRHAAPPRRMAIYYKFSAQVFKSVAASGWLRDLRELRLGSNLHDFETSTKELMGLFRDPAATPKLVSIEADFCLRPRDLKDWPRLKRLRRFVDGNGLGCGWTRPQSLRGLDLACLRELQGVSCGRGPDLRALAAVLRKSSITRLGLSVMDPLTSSSEPPISRAAAELLLDSPGFQRVQRLAISLTTDGPARDLILKRLTDPAATPNLAGLKIGLGYDETMPKSLDAKLRGRFGDYAA